MSTHAFLAALLTLVHFAAIVRALLVDGRDPYTRAAWVMALMLFPVLGVVAYFLVGEAWVSRGFRKHANAVTRRLAWLCPSPLHAEALDSIPPEYRTAFRTCEGIARTAVAAGNRATLAADSNAAIEGMADDIAAARVHVHLSTYIWLEDHNGLAMVEALCAAAARGVTCRVSADAIGSRAMIASDHWRRMERAGVRLCPSLTPPKLLGPLGAHRLDLRNHRKLMVVDGRVAWCGSQNLADPEFRVKPKYAPWVDLMVRLEGPVVAQQQLIFAAAWTVETDEDLGALVAAAHPGALPGGFPAIAFATGPLTPRGARSNAFVAAIDAAQARLTVTTPYFVPDPPLLAALVGAGRRGVAVRLVVPARNDSRMIGAISKALYAQLVDAGIDLFEYRGGLLHSKTLVADEALVMLGSSNMDRRSLELNFENDLLLWSPAFAAEIARRQESYIAHARAVDPDRVAHRSIAKRLVENLLTIAGAIF
ncbi:cardiolipin synthase [Sphingomonas sp. ASV193]|uniref:cardiolipin synthase n=1 Tax=Sphingomonas sp. ASV193 TaxID=3144405 RepID=UPI0032E8BB57